MAAEAQNNAAANARERDQYFANGIAKATKDRDPKALREILEARNAYNRDMLAQGRKEEVSTGQSIRPTMRRDMGATRKNQRFQERLNQQ